MNTRRVKIKHGQLIWPRHCVVCLEHPSEVVTITRKVLTESSPLIRVIPLVGLIPRTLRVVKVEMPVCARHRRFSQLVSALGRQNLLTLFLLTTSLAWLITSIVVAGIHAADGNAVRAGSYLVYAAIPAVIPTLYFWARAKAPVKIVFVDEQSLTLSFSNSMYSDFFEEENRKQLM